MGTLEDALNKCTTLVELLETSKRLKEEGNDVAYVNTLVSSRRRQMLRESRAASSMLKKNHVQLFAQPSVMTTRINIQMENKRSSKLVLTDTGAFIWE